MARITNFATLAAAVLLMLVAALVYIGPRVGYRVDTIISGSMRPALNIGTMVIAQKVDANTLKVGDIIAFKSPMVGEKNMAHRISQVITTNPSTFQTKGDALDKPDPVYVPAAAILGKIVFSFAGLGYLAGFLYTTAGLLVGLVVPSVIIIWYVFRALWKELVRYIRSSAQKAG